KARCQRRRIQRRPGGTENDNPEHAEESLLSPMVSGLEKGLEKLRSDIRKIKTVVDDTLSTVFRSNSALREKVYTAMNEQIQRVEIQLNIVKTLAQKNIGSADKESKEVAELLCSLYECDVKEIVQHSIDQSEKIELLQGELMRAKASERKKLFERRQMLLSGNEPMESEFSGQRDNANANIERIQLTPVTTTSKRMDCSFNGQRGQFQYSRKTSSSSENSESSVVSSLSTARLVNEYMRAAAMPNVKPFSNKKGEKFKDFLRQFGLKYPETTWHDSERRDILVGLLEGEAKMHYNTLPEEVKRGSLKVLIEAMKRRLKIDGPEEQASAMRKLRTLKKRDRSVLEFCLELEVLSRNAHPNADDNTLSLIRAEILQEQLSHWAEAVRLLEILETERGTQVYEKMKETALRVERLRTHTQMEKSLKRKWEFKAKEQPPRVTGDDRASTPENQDAKKSGGRTSPRSTKDVNCSNCGKKGHEARECWSKKKDRQAVSFSAILNSWCCKKVGSTKPKCEEVGEKHMVRLSCLGTKVSGMIDTGSQLTIIPLKVLKQARDRGEDMDLLCTQVFPPDIDAYDASGNKMDFLGCIELKLGIEGDEEHPIRAYVKKLHDNVILLGTNALETLGIHIRISKATSTEDAMCDTKDEWQKAEDKAMHAPQKQATMYRSGSQTRPKWKPNKKVIVENGRNHCKTRVEVSRREAESKPKEATVVNRVYVSPGRCVPVQLHGNGLRKDATLWSVNANIPTGVCRFSEEGTTEVPVLNHTSQPIIFHEGQKIGVWEEADAIQPATRDLESDMLELSMEPESQSDRIDILLNLLASNSKYGCFPEALTKLVKEFQDVFAVSDKELTQTDLIKHSIDTGDAKAIKQRTRPVPQGVRSELKNILNDLEERNIIRKSTSDWASPIVLVQKKDKTLRLSGLKQLVLTEDTSHPLHLKFVCHEKQLVKPPGDYKGYRIGFKCPLLKEENARKLSNVVQGLPQTMEDISFDSAGRLAQLITIWVKEDWSDDHKLMIMAKQKAAVRISGEALALALLYLKKKCLHVQLSLENLQPEDVYHEAIQDDEKAVRVSGIYQAALKLIDGQEWKAPFQKKQRKQYLLTPQCLSKIHMLMDENITVITYSSADPPKIELNSDVLLIIGPEEASADNIANHLAPWLESMAADDVQVAIGVAPMEHQTPDHEEKWTQIYGAMETLVENLNRVANHVRLFEDAKPGEWDHPHRSLGTAPYDAQGLIGFYATKRWYESVRKYWATGWPPAVEKPKKGTATDGLPKKRFYGENDSSYPPRKKNSYGPRK
ncbi:zinc knuckle, partial [Ostertagia ostertagi]